MQAQLLQYQWDTYNLLAEIPPHPFPNFNSYDMTLKEIDKFMRQAPSRSRDG